MNPNNQQLAGTLRNHYKMPMTTANDNKKGNETSNIRDHDLITSKYAAAKSSISSLQNFEHSIVYGAIGHTL